jgi:hypothetical protein
VIVKDDPDAVVVQVGAAQTDDLAGTPGAETAEPEIIGRKVEKDDEAEKK